MSLDTIAIFDVATPLEPLALLGRLSAEPALAALVPRFGAEWEVTDWSAQPSTSDPRVVDLVGPGGIVLRLGRRSVEVYHLLRFTSFAAGGEDHEVVRRAFRAIARIVGSRRAVYTHELAAADRDPDEGTDHVIANLTTAAGPASQSFSELARAQNYRAGSWYIDTFPELDMN
jgi:hypothetical protein